MLNKEALLSEFRRYAEEKYSAIPVEMHFKKRADRINNSILAYKKKLVTRLDKTTPKAEYLSDVMMLSYVTYIVMLEYRNKAWPYEYMSFSRRIGEIWEPFCKLPFYHSARALTIVKPPRFDNVQSKLNEKYENYILSLDLTETQRSKILDYYAEVWKLVDSGKINLSLDLHFCQDDVFYNVDYKSGYKSNEKGNVNRLLQVGSIYTLIGGSERTYRNLFFVRRPENENNHYLQTLKRSPYWNVYCAEEAYQQIHNFTGFDIQKWMTDNMTWISDISSDLRQHLENNNLLTYLSW